MGEKNMESGSCEYEYDEDVYEAEDNYDDWDSYFRELGTKYYYPWLDMMNTIEDEHKYKMLKEFTEYATNEC